MNSTEYEILIQEIYQTLMSASDGIRTINVQRDVELMGASGQKHQVDVFWSFEVAGIHYQTAIECKHYNSTINVGKIRDFSAMLADVGNINGIFVTTVGFQSGAKRFAKHCKIHLLIVRPPTEKDWAGRLKDIHLNIMMSGIMNVRWKLLVDDDWLKAYYPINTNFAFTGMEDELLVLRSDGSKISSFYDLKKTLGVGTFETALNETSVHEFGDDAFIIDDSGKPLKIKAISFIYDVQVSSHSVSLLGDKIAKAIMIDVLSGKMTFFDTMGRFRDKEPLPPSLKSIADHALWLKPNERD